MRKTFALALGASLLLLTGCDPNGVSDSKHYYSRHEAETACSEGRDDWDKVYNKDANEWEFRSVEEKETRQYLVIADRYGSAYKRVKQRCRY